MKRNSAIVFVLSFIIASCLLSSIIVRYHGRRWDRRGEKVPRLMIDRTEYRVKTVDQGEPANSGDILLWNVGSAPLVIKDVQSGCRCLPVEMDLPFTILPGEARELRFKVDTKDRRGDYRIPIRVTSNAVNAPHQAIYICGKVTPSITVSPTTVDLGVMDCETSLSDRTFAVKAVTRSPSKVSVERLPSGIRLSDIVTDRDTREHRFHFVVEPTIEPNIIEDSISFRAYDGRHISIAKTDIRASVFTDCVISPYPIVVGAIGIGRTRHIDCKLEFASAVHSMEVAHAPSCFRRVDVEKIDSDSYHLCCDVLSEEQGRIVNQKLLVVYRTESEGRHELSIPVSGIFYPLSGYRP